MDSITDSNYLNHRTLIIIRKRTDSCQLGEGICLFRPIHSLTLSEKPPGAKQYSRHLR